MRRWVAIFGGAATFVGGFAACDLELTPYVDPVDSGFSSSDVGGGGEAALPTDGAPDDALHLDDAGDGGARKRVFVTSSVSTGMFGNTAVSALAGADQLCVRLAAEAKVGGNFIAWLSMTNISALARVQDVGPWYLVDRTTRVFASKAAMATAPEANIDRDEKGAPIEDKSLVWTGTQISGNPSQQNCNNFSGPLITPGLLGLAGNPAKKEEWTQSANTDCARPLHLYCIEQ